MTSLESLLEPGHTGVVTMECQRGVIGDLATFPALAQAVDDTDMIATMARIVDTARGAEVLVVHALAHFRPDRLGSPTNAPLLAYAATIDGQLLEGSPAAQLVPELGPDARDAVSARRHGVSPFSGTDLDAILRSRGITTVVAVGVSLNVGMIGLAIEAVNLGYRVVIVTDATTAVPVEASAAILQNSMSQLATLVTTDEVIETWKTR